MPEPLMPRLSSTETIASGGVSSASPTRYHGSRTGPHTRRTGPRRRTGESPVASWGKGTVARVWPLRLWLVRST
jgi:hypothetical protein